MGLRVGSGFDFHRLEPGRKLFVGGVELESDVGSVGHSDGDALVHAVIDALFGALSLGDIGAHFPPDDPAYKDISSSKLLAQAVTMVESSNARVVNLDTTVFLEMPKVSPHANRIAESLANVIGIGVERISVKAKTMEGVGPVGKGEGYAATAIVLVEVD